MLKSRRHGEQAQRERGAGSAHVDNPGSNTFIYPCCFQQSSSGVPVEINGIIRLRFYACFTSRAQT